jgi:WD repeat-containing protein 35
MNRYSGVRGHAIPNSPCLAIGYENGRLQLMRHEKDPNALVIDTQMKNICLRWNPDGSLLAVSGTQYLRSSSGEEKEVCVVQFYNPSGNVRIVK